MFKQYRDALGKVGEGAHSYRIANIAVVDVLLTVIAAYIIHWSIYPEEGAKSFWLVLGILFLMGIVLHRLFCVRTTVDRWLFL
jgi:hypothetical protein